MKYKFLFFLGFIFLYTTFGHSQSISGQVLDARTHEPLETVTVYYDGTTIGTTTNARGEFNLLAEVATQATIVVSYLGYEAQYFSQEQLQKTTKIYLEEKAEALDAVYIEDDNWSREKKMKYFKREFLGRDLAAKDCRILNEDAIRLVYRPSKMILAATSNVPIQIKNDHLGYQVAYTIVDFEIQFKPSFNGWELVESVFYSGTSSFSETHKKTKRKHIKARELAYKGSVLHFMRSLSAQQLAEQKFETFINDSTAGSKLFFPVAPYAFLEVTEADNGFRQFEQKRDKLVVLYNGDLQSSLMLADQYNTFYIDRYGIHSPADKLFFSGDFGIKRIATMLPLDYRLEVE